MSTPTRTLPSIGDEVVCAYTGKAFIIAMDGPHTFNYATDDEGRIFSDEGVHKSALARMAKRTGPELAYISSDGTTVTTWKGAVLGTIVHKSKVRLTCGGAMLAIRVRDVHGGMWYGRGSPSMCVTLRPMKG